MAAQPLPPSSIPPGHETALCADEQMLPFSDNMPSAVCTCSDLAYVSPAWDGAYDLGPFKSGGCVLPIQPVSIRYVAPAMLISVSKSATQVRGAGCESRCPVVEHRKSQEP